MGAASLQACSPRLTKSCGVPRSEASSIWPISCTLMPVCSTRFVVRGVMRTCVQQHRSGNQSLVLVPCAGLAMPTPDAGCWAGEVKHILTSPKMLSWLVYSGCSSVSPFLPLTTAVLWYLRPLSSLKSTSMRQGGPCTSPRMFFCERGAAGRGSRCEPQQQLHPTALSVGQSSASPFSRLSRPCPAVLAF